MDNVDALAHLANSDMRTGVSHGPEGGEAPAKADALPRRAFN
jgi:hypothetical protein